MSAPSIHIYTSPFPLAWPSCCWVAILGYFWLHGVDSSFFKERENLWIGSADFAPLPCRAFIYSYNRTSLERVKEAFKWHVRDSWVSGLLSISLPSLEWREKNGSNPVLSVHACSENASENKWSAPNQLYFGFFESAQHLYQGFPAGLWL